jgi:hypothetical protein
MDRGTGGGAERDAWEGVDALAKEKEIERPLGQGGSGGGEGRAC